MVPKLQIRQVALQDAPARVEVDPGIVVHLKREARRNRQHHRQRPAQRDKQFQQTRSAWF